MITMLKNNRNGTYDVVAETVVQVGDKFAAGYTVEGVINKIVTVINIIEQRKERGKYVNENDRRFWAKVS